MYVSTRKSTARRACCADRGGGIGSSSPCIAPFVADRLTRDREVVPRHRRGLPLEHRESPGRAGRTRAACCPCSRRPGLLPLTVVAATSSRSGWSAASMSATASSVPVSTSRISFVAHVAARTPQRSSDPDRWGRRLGPVGRRPSAAAPWSRGRLGRPIVPAFGRRAASSHDGGRDGCQRDTLGGLPDRPALQRAGAPRAGCGSS